MYTYRAYRYVHKYIYAYIESPPPMDFHLNPQKTPKHLTKIHDPGNKWDPKM